MRFWIYWLLTLVAGIGIAFVLGWLVGLVWSLGGKIVFYGLSVFWVLIAFTYPAARRRGAF